MQCRDCSKDSDRARPGRRSLLKEFGMAIANLGKRSTSGFNEDAPEHDGWSA
jgi:hypothetical protein